MAALIAAEAGVSAPLDRLVVVDYDEAFPELAGVYLEDSWVLKIAPATDGVALRLEARS